MIKDSNFDNLKIPAFMRKRNLAARDRKKLLLTAFDRQKAGLIRDKSGRKSKKNLVTALDRKKAGILGKKKVARTGISLNLRSIDFENIQRKSIDMDQFASYELTSSKSQVSRQEFEDIGVITHYFQNIQVGVIHLMEDLEVGDEIVYGGVRQKVISMQINREDVNLVYAGNDVGIKLEKEPKIQEKVYKIIKFH